MLRSMPTIAPTNALTTTSNANCAAFARNPRCTPADRSRVSAAVIGRPRVRALRTNTGEALFQRSGLEAVGHRKAGRSPLGESLAKAPRAPAVGPEELDGAVGVDAIRSAA